jgi:hypothetical protein
MLAQQSQHFSLATVLMAGIEALSQHANTNAGDASIHLETAKEQVFPPLSETFRPLSGSFTPFSPSSQGQAERGEKIVDSYLVQTRRSTSMNSSSFQADFQKDRSRI